MKAAGIEGGHFHILRHTAAAWMVQGGADLYQVQKVLGHSTPVMTQRYAHLRPDHLRPAVRALDAAIRGASVDTPVDTATSPASTADSTALAQVAEAR